MCSSDLEQLAFQVFLFEIRFRKGTLGRQVAQILEGRKRPRWILEQKVSEVNEFKGERIRRALSKIGNFEELSVENVLSKKTWQLQELGLRASQVNAIQDSVRAFANNLQFPPEFKLLSSIYGERSRELIPPNAEKEEQLKDVVCEVVSSLTPREQRVLTLRYGLEDFREQDYKSVADQFNVTRERIRQIEAKALRKLRHRSRGQRLSPYLVEKEVATTEGTETSPEQNQEGGNEPGLSLVIRKNLPLDLETKEVKSESGSVQVAENLSFAELLIKITESKMKDVVFVTNAKQFERLVGVGIGNTLAYISDNQFTGFKKTLISEEVPDFGDPSYVARLAEKKGSVKITIQTKLRVPEVRNILKGIPKTGDLKLKFEPTWFRR